jgi:hypothetical protein
MASQTFQLVMRGGPNPGKIFELVQDELTIGRDIGNRIVINDPEVSRKHARLTVQSDGYVIEDLGSTNGTFVNNQRLIGPHMLRPGETIMLGEKISLEYEVLGFDPNATLVSGSGPQAAPPPSPETYRVETPDFGYPPVIPPVEPVQQPGYYQPPEAPAYQPPLQSSAGRRRLARLSLPFHLMALMKLPQSKKRLPKNPGPGCLWVAAAWWFYWSA